MELLDWYRNRTAKTPNEKQSENYRSMSKTLNFSPSDFDHLIEYALANNMCFTPGCTTCGARRFRRLCREKIGFEAICSIVRAVTPSYFFEHYTFSWMQVATVLDHEFTKEGGLPRDNFLLQELERLSQAHEDARRKQRKEYEDAMHRQKQERDAAKQKRREEHEEVRRTRKEEYEATMRRQQENVQH